MITFEKKEKKVGKKATYHDEVIRLYFERHFGYKRIAKALPVARSTACRWIHDYADAHPELNAQRMTQKTGKEEPTAPKAQQPEDKAQKTSRAPRPAGLAKRVQELMNEAEGAWFEDKIDLSWSKETLEVLHDFLIERRLYRDMLGLEPQPKWKGSKKKAGTKP